MPPEQLTQQLERIDGQIAALEEQIAQEANGIATAEQLEALTEANDAADRAAQQLAQDNRKATRNAMLDQPLGRQTAPDQAVDASEISGVRPQILDDPLRGYANEGEWAQDIFAVCVNEHIPSVRQEAAERLERSMLGEEDEPALNPRSVAAGNGLKRDVGTEAGFLALPGTSGTMFELAFGNLASLLSRFRLTPIAGDHIKLPADVTTPWGADGIKAKFRGEGDEMAATKPKTEDRIVPLHEMYAFVTETREAMNDAPRLAERITKGAARAIRTKASSVIVEGTGAGQPLGFRSAGDYIAIPKEAGQAADTIVKQNILRMFSRFWDEESENVFVMYNRDTIVETAEIVLGNQPLWLGPSSTYHTQPGGPLFGMPSIKSAYSETLGDQGDIEMVNPDGWIGITKARAMLSEMSLHFLFDTHEAAFKWVWWMGGAPVMTAPIQPKNGASTAGHFVGVAARA